MYKIKCDDFTIYNPLNQDLVQDLVIESPTLSLGNNKAGSLSFSIYPMHPHYAKIKRMKSIISVYQDNLILFKGRVFTDNTNFFNVKKVEVEGLLAYFNDSIVRPYTFSGTVEEYVDFLINQHNDQVEEFQKFKRGNVTVHDNNDYIIRANSNTQKTWEEIEDKLIKLLGGFICIRYEEDGNYIDYIEDFTDVSTQDIKFSINLLDLEENVSVDDFATCIIPYGASINDEIDTESEEKRIDIKSVNEGIDYIQDNVAVELYGKIYEVVIWEDVREPKNLLSKAKIYLSNAINFSNTLTVKAIDLHLTDEKIEAFKIGDYIKVYSKLHDIEEILLLNSYSVDLTNPSSFVFTLGREARSFMGDQIETDRNNSNRIDVVEKEVEENKTSIDKNLKETQIYINKVIENSEENIRTMLKEYSKVSDTEELNNKISLELNHTAEKIDMVFNTLSERITNENGEIIREINEISKYIRFVNGDIVLGEVGNDLTTKISNGRISFLYNDTLEVAYITDRKLYITEAEILTQIVIGNFAFIPRRNGNLSFMKVR